MESIEVTLHLIPTRLYTEMGMGKMNRSIQFTSLNGSVSFEMFDDHPNFDEIWEQAMKIIYDSTID